LSIYRDIVDHAHAAEVFRLLLLIAAANSAPVLAKRLFGPFPSYPLDSGRTFLDGQPILGPSKTIRGVLVAVIAACLCAVILGLPWIAGFAVGVTSMVGDLISSFVKRRMRLPPSSMALGLDQVPESLLPALVYKSLTTFSFVDVVAVTMLFFVGELVLSRLLFKLHIRDQPY
jgi:CDP-2,3-bis-(O-geranylgeranyl)-sn-glycerol synthase